MVVDGHTHTVASGHAFSTIQEMAREAPTNGIQMFAVTDHGPTMKGAPYLFHFGNLKAIPSELYGVRIIKGAEANIIEYEGKVDIPESYLKQVDYVIASFHEICIKPATIDVHTEAAIKALKNPLIDTIGHLCNPLFQVDIEKVVQTAREYNKPIEVNK